MIQLEIAEAASQHQIEVAGLRNVPVPDSYLNHGSSKLRTVVVLEFIIETTYELEILKNAAWTMQMRL